MCFDCFAFGNLLYIIGAEVGCGGSLFRFGLLMLGLKCLLNGMSCGFCFLLWKCDLWCMGDLLFCCLTYVTLCGWVGEVPLVDLVVCLLSCCALCLLVRFVVLLVLGLLYPDILLSLVEGLRFRVVIDECYGSL